MKYKSLLFLSFVFFAFAFVPFAHAGCNSDNDCNVAGGAHCYLPNSMASYCAVSPATNSTTVSSCSAGQNGVDCCGDNDCNVSAGAHCQSPGMTSSFCTFNAITTTSSNTGSTVVKQAQCLSSFQNGVITCPAGCFLDPDGQSCSANVTPTVTASSQQAACNQIASTNLSSDLQSNVQGTGPSGSQNTTYNNTYYATPEAASLLAQCLGGSLVSTTNEAAGSPFYIPPTLQIKLPNGSIGNAGQLLQQLITVNSGNLSNFQNGSYFNQVLNSGSSSSATNNSTGNSGTTQTGCTAGATYNVITGMLCSASSSSGTLGNTGVNSIVDSSCVNDGTCTAQQFTAIAQQQAVSQSQQAASSTNQQINTAVQNILNNIKTASSNSTLTSQFQNFEQSLGYNYNIGSGATQTTTPSSSNCPTALNTDLRLGNTGNDVLTLSQTLVSAGLLSAPTSTFDTNVFNAVVAYQEKNASAILTPVGLTVGSGFVGPSTRAFMNNACVKTTTTSTSVTTTTSTVSNTTTGGKTSNFDYTFTKVGNAWKVTLDNASLGSPTDFFYIPANYSITAISAYDLNNQMQGRFNNSAYFPGTPSGNTFYSQMFGAFGAAYYDWNRQTNTVSSSNAQPTVDSLSANGFQSITVNIGDTVNYAWSSVGGTAYSSYYSASKADTCSGGFTSSSVTLPWVANTASGSVSQTVQPCQAGVSYTIDYRIQNTIGTPDTVKSIIVNVTNQTDVPATQPITTNPVPPVSTPVSPTGSGQTLASNYISNIGVYHWGPFSDPLGPVVGGVNFAANKGFKIVRLALSPKSSMDYGVSNSCDSGLPLKKLILLNGFPQALANSSISTFVLTTYDSATFSDCVTKKYFNPSFYTTANVNAISQEYYDLAMYLYQTYKNTGKQFIISNWEGDNDLYCGQAYSYATDPAFRSNCDKNYSSMYNGNTSVNDSITAMKMWINDKNIGLNNAKAAAVAQGITGVTVSLAGEMNIVSALHNNGYKSMLYDVLPYVSLDYVSYSSYESINNSAPVTTLNADIQTIKNVTGINNIIVGEFGYTPDQVGATIAPAYLQQVASDISSSGATYGIIWQLFDQPNSNFGLFTQQGSPTSLFNALLK